MSGFLVGLVGAVAEAWQELRIHRTRVLLSLIGVAVAVCAITTVVGLGGIAEQANRENSDRNGGRAATLSLSASTPDGSAVDPAVMQSAWSDSLERYGISYASRVTWGSATVQFVDGAVPVQTIAMDPPYATMHRVQLDQGTWWDDTDADRYAPSIIVNEAFWQRLGSPPLSSNPTVPLLAENSVTAVVTGVYRSGTWDTEPAMYMLQDAYDRFIPTDPTMPSPPQYELWVPTENSDALRTALESDFTSVLGDGAQVFVNRQDWGAQQDGDPFLSLKLMVGGVALLVLLLGALGLINIALVTVRYRIREIGIRRSFGATSGRVFFSVMMESIVGTVVAGIVGVGIAVVIVTSPWLVELIGQGMVSDVPPFPIEAAVIGLLAATVVGALAGLLPAVVAVRVKVIDAIRY
ncbi:MULTISPECIES: ABC transporter permease [unclassified Leifsonia]|uniref:ABC transporter permease n=1 Tax=unclassified Leifsonia TaxID=2663824 RepID=UPI0006F1FD42|nr:MULTISPECIES: ABC transporter permease [unclassified Leifsonia]KQX06636.1 hypothetical protein ASC59_01910 [Leifsonia sp. Root1293]KRA10920.1 hypothetical protein ASD61_01910 [Leifsonia sp. Root60]